ncbi:MAG: nitrite/sulfite reductase, partial [Candidatus Omnitrophica bacterium]|nr:nitrite/sulfite reductase [Candidatus Omnitrophota bacterium]
NCALATATDLGFIAYKDSKGRSYYKVYAGGGLGAHSVLGQVLEEALEPEKAGSVAEAVKRVFDRHGERQNRYRARLRFLVEKIGFTKFRELFREELKQLSREGPVVLRKVFFPQPSQTEKQQNIPPREDTDFELWEKYNLQNQARPNDAILEIRLDLGDLRAEQALALADLCSAHPGIEIRASQYQNLLLCHVPAKDIYPIYERLKAVKLARPYAATVADVISCAGATTCTLGICNSKGVAREISSLIEQEGLDFETLRDIRIKISGCPNSCSQHPVAVLGLQGLARRVGERMVPYYRIFAGGTVVEGQSKLAGEMGMAPARNIPRLVVDFLKEAEKSLPAYRDFYEFIDKQGAALFAGLTEKYAHVPAYEENSSFYKDWGKTEDFSLAETTPNK